MKILTIAFAFCIVLSSINMAQTAEINSIPKPRSVRSFDGERFTLSRRTKIVASSSGALRIAGVLNEFLLRRYGFKIKITDKPQGNNAVLIVITPGGWPYSNPEGYGLRIHANTIGLINSERGSFNALQTLFQILPLESKKEISIPALEIFDAPRFPYRGMHLDVGRHFMPVEFVKKYIDLMSQYKFNYFHWHLTEDQGWRIEIKKYPKLTEIGSKRPETVKDKNLQPYIGDGVPHEGFYTQEQIRDVVAYAKARYITVIPEIELPGHSSSALAAYPELGCKADYKYKVQTTWGIFKDVYCPTEKTFGFLEDVLTEVIGLFPDSPYIHIGGDEVLKDQWKESPEVASLMARENLKDVNEVQSYFVRRMEKFINSKGKKIIGWDEILEGGLAPNATVMSWRGIKGGIAAAKEHHDVIMTPTDYVYFDYGQGDPATEPLNIGGYLPLEKVYSFDPVPKELNADEAKYIIGGQGNVWTEYLPTPASVEYMAFPRMLALSEVLWSTPENKNYADFTRRLGRQFARLDQQNVNYRIPEPIGLRDAVLGKTEAPILALNSVVPDSKIYFSYDGQIPTTKSSLYARPLGLFSEPATPRIDVKTIVVLPNGRTSSIYTATYLRQLWHGPEPDLKEKRAGVTYSIVIPASGNSPDPIITSGETKSMGLAQFAKTTDLKKPFGASFDGYFNAPVDAIYEFQIESTWDADLFIGGEKLVGQLGTKDRAIHSEVLPLRAGLHKIGMRYNNQGGEPFFRVRWAIKGQNWHNIGGGELMH